MGVSCYEVAFHCGCVWEVINEGVAGFYSLWAWQVTVGGIRKERLIRLHCVRPTGQ
jgi:hypothetical protein